MYGGAVPANARSGYGAMRSGNEYIVAGDMAAKRSAELDM